MLWVLYSPETYRKLVVDDGMSREEYEALLVDASHRLAAGQSRERHAAHDPARQTDAMHLAVFNIGRLRAPMDDPLIDDFRNNLDRINALAEESPGFVWRLQDESGNATNITPYPDPMVITNMAVWESIDELADFTYRSGHLEQLRRRRDFFEPMTRRVPRALVDPRGPRPDDGRGDGAPRAPPRARAHARTPSPSAIASSPATTRSREGSDLDTCPA